jgi:hypothetical protein
MIDIYKEFLFSSQKNNERNFEKLKPEQKECVIFANACKSLNIEGKLNAVWLHIPNEIANNRHPRFGSLQKRMGKIAGAADYVFLGEKNSCFIEFKVKTNTVTTKQNKNQLMFEEWCKKIGVNYFLVYSTQEALQKLREIKLLRD